MAKVVALGGVFFKSNDPQALRAWYRDRPGVDVQSWGGAQFLHNKRDSAGIGYAVWSPFDADTTYFDPSTKPFMVNLRVDEVEAMLAGLRAAGAQVLDRRDDGENGKFGYVMDPEGNLLELWEQATPDPYVPPE